MIKYVMVDIEADGPCPGLFSMLKIGAVIVEPKLDRTFYAELCPLEDAEYVNKALRICNVTRKQSFDFPFPFEGMLNFENWLNDNKKHIDDEWLFISDNNGFDWQFINYYFHEFTEGNPFGHSSTNLGNLYKGIKKNLHTNFKHLRKTKHDHNPVNDAIGNAEAFMSMDILKINNEK